MTAQILHGGALDAAIAEFGGERRDWLDLSTGINPDSYPVPKLPDEIWSALPDRSALNEFEKVARNAYRVPDEMAVVAAPGTQSLIELVPRVLPGRTATIIAPGGRTYGEHAHCCKKAGREVRFADKPDLVRDEESLAVLVQPNNPDGTVWPIEPVQLLARRMKGAGFVVIDEAFADTMPEQSLVPRMNGNMLILRSFGKFFGLAGVRLGVAIGAEEIISEIRSRLGPWAVSGPALAIGTAALSDSAWIDATRDGLKRKSALLTDILEHSGFAIVGANLLFVLARHDRAQSIRQLLLKNHILVRAFDDDPKLLRFGLPSSDEDRDRLISTLMGKPGKAP